MASWPQYLSYEITPPMSEDKTGEFVIWGWNVNPRVIFVILHLIEFLSLATLKIIKMLFQGPVSVEK